MSITNVFLETPVDDFVTQMKETTLGEMMAVQNHLKMEYENSNNVRQSLLLMNDAVPTQDKEVFESTLNSLMVAMQLIEDRVSVLQELISERMGTTNNK